MIFDQQTNVQSDVVPAIEAKKKSSIVPAEEYYLFPHEFLCLVCNAKDRIKLLHGAFRLNFCLDKCEHFNNPGDNSK